MFSTIMNMMIMIIVMKIRTIIVLMDREFIMIKSGKAQSS